GLGHAIAGLDPLIRLDEGVEAGLLRVVVECRSHRVSSMGRAFPAILTDRSVTNYTSGTPRRNKRAGNTLDGARRDDEPPPRGRGTRERGRPEVVGDEHGRLRPRAGSLRDVDPGAAARPGGPFDASA